MQIDAEDAVRIFFKNTSFEMVFFEAVANAFDADASNISIFIEIDNIQKPGESLKITIKDDGNGFTEQNFKNFCKAGKQKDSNHKGIGRILFLKYFEKVCINSFYNGNKNRKFTYDSKFQEECSEITLETSVQNSTELIFMGFKQNLIHSYDYLSPETLADRIMKHFLLRLYDMKNSGKKFCISVTLDLRQEGSAHKLSSGTKSITQDNLIDLTKAELPSEDLSIFSQNLDIFYFIRKNASSHFVQTGIEVDGRIVECDLIDEKMLPPGCQVLFLVRSEWFNAKIDSARCELQISEGDSKIIKRILRKGICKILDTELPSFTQKKQKISSTFSSKYPYLTGYFDDQSIGLIDENKSLDLALNQFLLDQKSVLDAEELDDNLFEKSLNISARILTQYILYRNLIINKLKSLTPENSEEEIHNLIVPKKRVISGSVNKDLYNNNIWLLDDKYMSFSTILSDMEMYKLIDEIAEPEEKEDKKRPDIAVIFSKDVHEKQPVDVVIVELKKKGADINENVKVTTQLWQRAKKLIQYYPDKIQRIWFYGIVTIDDEFAEFLVDKGWKELFSLGRTFYLEEKITVNYVSVPVGYFLTPYDSLLSDAAARNETFLKILKDSVRQQTQER